MAPRLSFRTRLSFGKGFQGEGVGPMIIDHFGRTHPLRATDRAELSQGLIEFVCARTARQEEVELFEA